MNRVTILGRLGKDPETKNFDNGSSVTNLTLATDESYKDKDGNKVEKTEWHNVAFFGKQGEVIAKYVTKGQLLLIEGKLQTRSYEKDGEKRYLTEIIGNSFEFISGQGSSNPSQPKQETTPAPVESQQEDDLPF